MESFLEQLESLPHWALYGSMAVIAAIENIFPPIPADTVVALGAFLAARGQGSAPLAFLAVWVGNVAGAMVMYVVGRRVGAASIERFARRSSRMEQREHWLQDLYARFGLGALALGRLLPGVRALVPPFAGALHLSALRVLLVIALPSGIWYAIVTYVGYETGANLDDAMAILGSLQIWLVVVAAVIVGGALLAWYARRRRKAR